MREVTPCKGCKERDRDCHSICDKYREWSQSHQEDVQRQREARDKDRPLFPHLTKKQQIEGAKRRRGK
jgi:hypothetical protein